MSPDGPQNDKAVFAKRRMPFLEPPSLPLGYGSHVKGASIGLNEEPRP
jgi:hypothetical protein